MSNDILVVRFPDGEIRRGVYHGTSDVCYPWLWHCQADAWEFGSRIPRGSWHEPKQLEATPDEVFDVEIVCGYGYGSWWKGRATKRVLLEGLSPWDEELRESDEWPEWMAEIEPELYHRYRELRAKEDAHTD